VVSATTFVLLALLLTRHGAAPFDEPVATLIDGLPVPMAFWELCTFLGGWILIPIAVGFCAAVVSTGRIRLALICAAVLIVATLFTDLVKDLIARPRPVEGLESVLGYGFPSGHTLNSTATYGLIALVVWRSDLSFAIRRSAVVIGVTLPILVGLSRVALGVHFPSDVVGGWSAGITFVAIAAVTIRATGAMSRERPRIVESSRWTGRKHGRSSGPDDVTVARTPGDRR
jgi:undecaprenyl-diphosphatase